MRSEALQEIWTGKCRIQMFVPTRISRRDKSHKGILSTRNPGELGEQYLSWTAQRFVLPLVPAPSHRITVATNRNVQDNGSSVSGCTPLRSMSVEVARVGSREATEAHSCGRQPAVWFRFGVKTTPPAHRDGRAPARHKLRSSVSIWSPGRLYMQFGPLQVSC